jgi:hypothetical protein
MMEYLAKSKLKLQNIVVWFSYVKKVKYSLRSFLFVTFSLKNKLANDKYSRTDVVPNKMLVYYNKSS